MAVFVMQSLGFDVSAINTVHFSMPLYLSYQSILETIYYLKIQMLMVPHVTGNHVAYGQFSGRETSGEEIRDIYKGLDQNYLTDFDMLLSGFAPNADIVEAIADIGKDLKRKASSKPGSFFWGLF